MSSMGKIFLVKSPFGAYLTLFAASLANDLLHVTKHLVRIGDDVHV